MARTPAQIARHREHCRAYRQRLRERAYAIHGTTCVVCGEPAEHLAHVHATGLCGPGRGMERRYLDAIRNREDYVAVCRRHNNEVDYARKAKS